MTRSEVLADEAVQETFIRAWRYLDSFRSDGTMEGWLIRICRRCVIDMVAREQRADVVTIRPAVQPPDRRPEVWALLDGLSAADREVLVICGVLGYDYQSAGTILDLPVGTVRSRLSRARARFRDAIESAEAG